MRDTPFDDQNQSQTRTASRAEARAAAPAGAAHAPAAARPSGPSPAAASLERLRLKLDKVEARPRLGRIERVADGRLWARIDGATIGAVYALDRLSLDLPADAPDAPETLARVVGLDGAETAELAALGPLDGVSEATSLRLRDRHLSAPTGDALLGRVLDGFGRPLDAERFGPLPSDLPRRPATLRRPAALDRPAIHRPFLLGAPAIDGLATLGEGQRVELRAEPGAAATAFLADLLATAAADVVVLAALDAPGRRLAARVAGREAADPDLAARVVVVAADAERAPEERAAAPFVAMAIAEAFRDAGRRVLVLVDDLTAFTAACEADRAGLGDLPALLERPGAGPTGSVTALFVTRAAADRAGASAERALGLTEASFDGRLVLRSAPSGYDAPLALDPAASRSDAMALVASAPHLAAAARVLAGGSAATAAADLETLMHDGAPGVSARAEPEAWAFALTAALETLAEAAR